LSTLHEIMGRARAFLEFPLFQMGSGVFTIWTLLYLVLLTVVLFYLSGKLRSWIADRLLAQSRLQLGVRQAAGTIARYVVIAIGLLVILQTAGIDLTTLNVVAGAVGIGVGFGLQNVASNFISGLIILFERPVKTGDRIEVGGVEGSVTRIGARSTTVLTNDNISIIIPNSKIIAENVVNWSHTDDQVRFKIPVGVAYNSDVRLVEQILLEVARENPEVLQVPAPAVRFIGFGDSSLNFELRVWTITLTHRPGVLISSLNFAIFDKFRAKGVEIPYPQRDLHIRSGALELKQNAPKS